MRCSEHCTTTTRGLASGTRADGGDKRRRGGSGVLGGVLGGVVSWEEGGGKGRAYDLKSM